MIPEFKIVLVILVLVVVWCACYFIMVNNQKKREVESARKAKRSHEEWLTGQNRRANSCVEQDLPTFPSRPMSPSGYKANRKTEHRTSSSQSQSLAANHVHHQDDTMMNLLLLDSMMSDSKDQGVPCRDETQEPSRHTPSSSHHRSDDSWTAPSSSSHSRNDSWTSPSSSRSDDSYSGGGSFESSTSFD